MAARRTAVELDTKVKQIVDETFADFEKYLPSPQDVAVYRRKRQEYWDKINARIKEECVSNGRTDDTAAAAAAE